MPDSTDRDRRFMVRYPSKAGATIIRESDMMRGGIAGRLTDVTAAGVGLRCGLELPMDETVKIQLQNDVQRFHKEVRGIIRHCTSVDEEFQIGIELLNRLTPLEVSLLRMGLAGNQLPESGWI